MSIMKRLVQTSLIALALSLITACSQHARTSLSDSENNASTHAYGVNGPGSFGQALEGENYSTKAPHNQVWLFAFDDDHLNKKYLPALDAQAHYLQAHPNARIMLAGHTDLRGSREYNVALGERRAKAVARQLRKQGVAQSQYRIVSYGKERPIDLAYNGQAHQKNRRVELIYEATR